MQIATEGRVSPFVLNNKNALHKCNGAIFPMMLPPQMVHFKQWLPFRKQSKGCNNITWANEAKICPLRCPSGITVSFVKNMTANNHQTSREAIMVPTVYFYFPELIVFFHSKPKCAPLFPLLFSFQPVFSQPACRG